MQVIFNTGFGGKLSHVYFLKKTVQNSCVCVCVCVFVDLFCILCKTIVHFDLGFCNIDNSSYHYSSMILYKLNHFKVNQFTIIRNSPRHLLKWGNAVGKKCSFNISGTTEIKSFSVLYC